MPVKGIGAGTSFPTTSTNTAFGTGFGSTFGKPVGGGFGSGFGSTSAKEKDGEGDDDEGGEGGDDGLVPLDPPEEILRNEQDKDDILYEVPCKLFRFNKAGGDWADKGKGTCRVTCNADSKKKRLLIRNTLGKITLNVNFFKGMAVKKSGKNGVQFFAPDESNGIQLFCAKVNPNELDKTYEFLSRIEAELP
jgi:hypothetical protein